jgi:hypothetical protein
VGSVERAVSAISALCTSISLIKGARAPRPVIDIRPALIHK